MIASPTVAPVPDDSSLAGAQRASRTLTRNANENFHVLTRWVPPALRDDFAAVYAFCRQADDIADNHPNTRAARDAALRTLEQWHDWLDACATGRPHDGGPVFIALGHTIHQRRLSLQPFHDLLDAFEQDQVVSTYESWQQLLDYSARSANPVGRIVLMLFGYGVDGGRETRPEMWAASDAICTGLQLANFWQDVRRDLDALERVYLPTAEIGLSPADLRRMSRESTPEQREHYRLAVKRLCLRTAILFEEGKALPDMLIPEARPVIRLFLAGGVAVLRKIERSNFDTLWARPRLGTLDKSLILARVAISSLVSRFSPSPR